MKSSIKKGINIWSFPGDMTIVDCMKLAKKAGFEGIELALALKGNLSLESDEKELISYKNAADDLGLTINSLATGLYWQFSVTSNREDIREKALKVARKQLETARILGADCILFCPGAVGVDFQPGDVVPDARDIEYFIGSEVIDYDIAYERAQSALKELIPSAKEKGVIVAVENIWNKFLLSPLEMKNFIDEIDSEWVQVYLDVANMVLYGYPEHWIKILGKRIKKVHFKDYRREAHGLAGFVDLLAGDVNYIKVIDEFIKVGYDGWANAEMCPTYKYYSDQMIYNTSATVDRILRRK